MYYAMAHSFLGGLVSFSVRIETYWTQVRATKKNYVVSIPLLLTNQRQKTHHNNEDSKLEISRGQQTKR